MKKLLLVGLLLGFLMPVLAIAQSDFDGTWKVDLNKAVMPNEPDVFLLQNGIYQCKTCVPAATDRRDGRSGVRDAQEESLAGALRQPR
jgi:hypothetical protein